MSRTSEDDLGRPVTVPDHVTRVVSLVPSLTESVAASAAGLLVGATDWCMHPASLDIIRIGGTKNPRVADVIALRPDVVLANAEENREPDLEELRAAVVAVWVTSPETVPEALHSLDRMLREACDIDRPTWLDEAEAAWRALPRSATHRRAVVPIWRRPWMALGRDTFAGDVLSRLGVANVLSHSPDRYPKIRVADAKRLSPTLVVLPDEPYPFSRDDGPDAFADWDVDIACVSGRHLTWYGPSLVEAPTLLREQLNDATKG